MNLLAQGLQLQAASIGEYYRDVFRDEPVADVLADAARNGVTAWCDPKTGRCRICKTCPDGWHAVNGRVQ